MTRLANLYHHDGRLFVATVWTTPHRLDVPEAPLVILAGEAGDGDIGRTVLDAMAQSRDDLPEDEGTLDEDAAPVLRAAGVKRWRTFVREAAHVHAWTRDDGLAPDASVALNPSRNFDYLPDTVSCPARPEALGAAVREAFRRCRPPVELGSGVPSAAPRGTVTADDPPVGFGPKTAWLAVKASDPPAVARALGLVDARPAPWREGVEQAVASDDLVFVTPVLDGWVLAVGAALGERWPEEIGGRLANLSRDLGEVHYYVTHRVSDYAAWARARDGRTERVFAFAGEALEEGRPDEAERGLGIDLETRFPDEADVLSMARAWSLDPTDLDGRSEPSGPGLLGRWPPVT